MLLLATVAIIEITAAARWNSVMTTPSITYVQSHVYDEDNSYQTKEL